LKPISKKKTRKLLKSNPSFRFRRLVDRLCLGVALKLRCFSGGLGEYPQKPQKHAWAINEAGKVVGNSSTYCNFDESSRPFLPENGQLYDLNLFVPADSDLSLREAELINDRDDITGLAELPNGDIHEYLLLRCAARAEGCENAREHPNSSSRVTNASPSTGRQSGFPR